MTKKETVSKSRYPGRDVADDTEWPTIGDLQSNDEIEKTGWMHFVEKQDIAKVRSSLNFKADIKLTCFNITYDASSCNSCSIREANQVDIHVDKVRYSRITLKLTILLSLSESKRVT